MGLFSISEKEGTTGIIYKECYVLIPEGGFYRINRIMQKRETPSNAEKRILCTEKCMTCSSYIEGDCTCIERLKVEHFPSEIKCSERRNVEVARAV